MVEEFKVLDKDQLFDNYSQIIENFKNYDDIDKNEMIKTVRDFYLSDYHHVIDICSLRELELLKDLQETKFSDEDILHNSYLLKELIDKFLIYPKKLCVCKELKDVVKEALDNYDEEEVHARDKINELAVGIVMAFGFIIPDLVIEITSISLNIPKADIRRHMATNLYFRFYVMEDSTYAPSIDKEIPQLSYARFWEFKDDFEEAKENGPLINTIHSNFEDFVYMGRYGGLNINNPKVKALYDIIKDKIFTPHIIFSINMHVLMDDDREELIIYLIKQLEIKDEKKFRKIFNEALDEIPSGVYNTLTRNEALKYLKNKEKSEVAYENFNEIQVNACIEPKDTKLFYKLYFALLEYTNNLYNVNPKVKKIYKQLGVNPEDIQDIIEKLWEDKDKIIDDFVKENPYNLNNTELKLVREFKKGIRKEFIIGKYEKKYALFMPMDDEKIVYIVKGLTSSIDEVVHGDNLPFIATTTLLPFKSYIIYDGVFFGLAMSIGPNMKNDIRKNIDKAKRISSL